jgi:hypothetical protein
MLRFFRQIRQRLLTDNKFSKYLLYAVGEILLVVIGILIALQINNWNENRKTRIVEIELLKTIKSDLESTLVDIHDDYENHLKSQNSGIRFDRFLRGENMPEDSIVLHFYQLSQDRHFFPKTAGYESLKSSDMTIISNDSLKVMITELYEVTFRRIKEWDESNPRWDIGMALYPYLKKHFILTDEILEKELNISGIPLHKLKLKSLEEIRNDNDFRIDLQETFQQRNRKIWLTKIGIDSINRTRRNIIKELERFNAKE